MALVSVLKTKNINISDLFLTYLLIHSMTWKTNNKKSEVHNLPEYSTDRSREIFPLVDNHLHFESY
jgi:hypothetical protein